MFIKELSNSEFEMFTNTYKDFSIYQTCEYAFVMNEQNYDSIFLGLIENNKVLAASLILIEKNYGFKYAYAPRGFLIDYNNFELLQKYTDLIKKYLNKKGVIAIKINPLIIRSSYCDKSKQTILNNDFENIFQHLKELDYYHLGYNNFFESFKPRFEGIINLDLPTNDLFININKKFKTKIRKADKSGVRIFKGNDTNLEYLYLQTKNKYKRNLKYFEDI